ncbi:HEAT repeat domain-containing protein [Micromonospora echinofusca]|uniref:DUF4062 domain-containing protein n=1 Tax=Micromonospora echinofusca TaxID=47858 RepID=A0ABS3VKX5_MICEH|nr:HEAT repeat domain-containing protein [Micromonospora echinofusca]MBO4205170.1 DUF4062 domain-containing protein [Micromonospora echinofusca]
MTKVYVSATFRDLQECRAAVQLALRRLRVEDVAMESYVAEDRRPLERCLADVRECDIYIGIFAWRYGFIPTGYDQSITELEYREAVATKKPCLIFLLDEDAPWPRRHVDRNDDADRIERLRAELAGRHMCSPFTDPADLATLVTAAVANCLAERARPAPGPPALGQDTLTRYLARLRLHYGVLDSDALTPAQAEDYLQIQLASVFVEPSVREDPPLVELPRDWLLRTPYAGWSRTDGALANVDPPDLAHLREAHRAKPLQRLFDVLGSPDRRTMVLLGDPGAGKSTAARYVVLSLATGHPDERLGALNDHLPLLVELRSYVAWAAGGRAQGFLDYLDQRAGTDGLGVERGDLLRHLEDGGRAVFIFDGLDEILDRRRREEVTGQIAGFASDHPDVRVVVTSRSVGYARRVLTEAGFRHYTLQDLTPAQVDEFLANWYRLAMRDRPEDGRLQRARLLDAILHSPAIRELAGNPLLLTILAIVGRHQALPRERWKLYDHAATVLVEQWDVNRHLHDREQGPDFIDTEDKKELLRRLAHRMQSAERGLAVNCIPTEELLEVFENYLVERYQRDRAAARTGALAMIRQFRERNFILSRYGPHVYGFVHRTFLEFFCAEALLNRFQHAQVLTFEELRELYREHWGDNSWREVLRLLCGALHPRYSAQLIELLTGEVNRPWPPGPFTPPPWNLALAVQCLAEVRNVSTVERPARALLRQIILLLEHGVGIDDTETATLFEEEILPAAKAIGANWPGRESYLAWYRRRGARLVWSPASAHAARLAALLATPAERIDDLFDEVLGSIRDSPAAYASVAGLAEVAQLATTAVDSAAHEAAATRTRDRLIRRARDEDYSAVRLAAVQAVGEHFGGDPRAGDLLLERAGADRYHKVRLAAVQALGERFDSRPGVRDLLRQRVRVDEHPAVRLAAVGLLGERYPGDDGLRDDLLDCLRTDRDPTVVRTAAQVLVERFSAGPAVRDLLLARTGDDTDRLLRRAVVRVLGERFAAEPAVRELLLVRVRTDRDVGVVRAAGRCVLDQDWGTVELRDLLVKRLHHDADEAVRRAVLKLLVRSVNRDPSLVDLLVGVVDRDGDADVRLLAAVALADRIGTEPSAGAALSRLARTDPDAGVRLVAVRSLVDRVGLDPAVRTALTGLAADDPAANIRLAAVEALAECVPGNDAMRSLMIVRARVDTDPTVRLAALRAVTGEVGHSDELLVDRARQDADGPVFAHAATAVLNRDGATGQVRELLVGRVSDPGNARIRLVAVHLLVERFEVDATIRQLLLERVRDDPDPEVVREAAVAVVRSVGPDQEQCRMLVERATGDDVPVRCVALRVLGEWFGADRTVRELLIRRATDDADVQVRREVLRVLGERLADHPEVRTLFVERLVDADWSVRGTAVLVLGLHFGPDEETRSVLAGLAHDDPDPGFRRLAGQALTWLPGADPDHLPDLGP